MMMMKYYEIKIINDCHLIFYWKQIPSGEPATVNNHKQLGYFLYVTQLKTNSIHSFFMQHMNVSL